jgi:Mlc titration factor MtfA (ptsG expression regulator)
MNPQIQAAIIVVLLIAGFLLTALFLLPGLFAGLRVLIGWSPRFFAWLEPLVFWFDDQRRKEILSQPFPGEWLEFLKRNVPHYSLLSETEKAKLRNAMQIFIAEKHWEGCRGLEVTDEMKVTIAGQACLLTLGMEKNYFPRVKTILVYPGGFRMPKDRHAIELLEGETTPVLGVAWYRGPVILSWDDIVHRANDPGGVGNLVIHEFAHQLDMQGGPADGTPPLPSPKLHKKWRTIMKAEFERLVEESNEGRATLLDQYGTVNEGEFFAVASECFFEQPAELSRRHAELYGILRRYYRQDPAVRRRQHAASEFNVGPANPPKPAP